MALEHLQLPVSLQDFYRDLGRELHIPDLHEIVEDACLEIDGVAMALDAAADDFASTFTCHVDLGPLDDEVRVAAMELALATNLTLEGSERGVIGWHADTDRLVLTKTLHVRLNEGAAQLGSRLRRLAQFSRDFHLQLDEIRQSGMAQIAEALHFA